MQGSDPLDVAYARAAAAWPTLQVTRARFTEAASGADPGSLAAEDLYLACACADGDARAIALLETHYMAPLARSLAARFRDDAMLSEVLQRLRIRALAPDGGIASYRGRGRLASWLRVAAIRLHATLAGARGHEPLPEDALVSPALLPEVEALRREHGEVMSAALREAIAALASRDRALLQLCYVDGLSMDRIGTIYGVNKGTVSRWLASIREKLRDAVVARVAETTGASAAEIQSLLGAVASSLDVSLGGLLRSGSVRAR